MSITITTTPVRNVNDSAALPSRWVAVQQPIIFGACRRDCAVIQGQILNGVYRLLLPAIPPDLVVGQKIWLSSGANNKEVTVLGISGNQISVTPTGLAPATTGGYINLTEARRNYYAQIAVFAVDANNTYYRVGALDSKPAPDGNFSFDVHGYLKTQAELTDTFAYNALNKKRIGAGGRFNFTTQEFWHGSDTVPSTLSGSTTFYWVNSCKQIQQKYNTNVGEFVPFPAIDTARFLSDFERPTYFPGFPFSLSFIWSDKVATRQLAREVEGFDQSADLQFSVEDDLDTAGRYFVNQLTLLNVGIDESVKYLDVWLQDTGLATQRYVAPGYVQPGYVANFPSILPVKAPTSRQ